MSKVSLQAEQERTVQTMIKHQLIFNIPKGIKELAKVKTKRFGIWLQ